MSALPTNRDRKDLIYAVSDHPRELTGDDLAFLANYTGKDPQALKPHVISVWQATKQQCWAFKCVQDFLFLTPRICLHPHYQAVCAASQNASLNNKLLHMDVGCCYGQDTRQLIMDGWKHGQLLASDLVPNYWDLGKTLFMDEDHMQVPFLAGSMTDDAFVSESNPLGTTTEHLLGRIDFIWAGLVLHVLSKEDCNRFLSNACSLLKRGGSFYGVCAGQKEAGEFVATPDGKARRFLHSKESLREAMLHVGFEEADVRGDDGSRWDLHDETLISTGILLLVFTAIK